jgi:hypothetical protein
MGVALLLAACATAPPASPERQAELRARAQACMRRHPEVERYEVDRFGSVTAQYRMAGSATATTDPFFRCVFGRE